MDQEPHDETPGEASLNVGELDRLIEDGGLAAFRADPRPAGEKVRPLLRGYFGSSQVMAYIFIFGGILALLLVAILFRLLGLAPG